MAGTVKARSTETERSGSAGGQDAWASAGGAVNISSASKRFSAPSGKQLVVLDDVSLRIAPGEFVAIVGPSGCGKTTLLRAIQGLERLTSGELSVGGMAPLEQASGFVFQKASLLPWRTVQRNVTFGQGLRIMRARAGGRPGKEAMRKHAEWLLELTGLTEFRRYYPHQLSGGMQQRANLARALAIRPNVLLMDEPFSALDAQTRESLQLELQNIIVEAKTTTVFVTHDIREAVFLADRVVVMTARPGRVARIVDIPVPRPRDAKFQNSDELAEMSRHIWTILHGEHL